MYARDLMFWLHERLADPGTIEQTQKRFESLRGYGLLPRGRENAGVRLSNEQIASAVLGFAHPSPGFAGHASLILGDLRPVGGVHASFRNESSLLGAVATLIGSEDANPNLLRLILSVEHDFGDDEYVANIYSSKDGFVRTTSFVSKYASSLLGTGADEGYNHERLDKLTAVQRSYGFSFFRDLSSTVSISRHLGRPFKTDWREYETEEEKKEFHQRLGARSSSRFLNLRVDAQVTWPKEPTRIKFGGHHLVLFPRTKDNSHSVSLDLTHERISANDARSLINRMLSVMSWCDDRPASLHEGWSGNRVPVPVSRQNLAFMTMHEWHFYRSLPDSDELRKCLAYYRDGLNAYAAGLASHAVLSFFRVFETKYDKKPAVRGWVNEVFPRIKDSLLVNELREFEKDRETNGADPGTYVYVNCRVATAHAARDAPSDPDGADEARRLFNAAHILQRLARYFIKQEFQFSDSYLTDEHGPNETLA